MRGEMHDAVLRKLARFAQALHLALGGARAKPDFARIGAQVARHGAQFVGRLGQRRLPAQGIPHPQARRASRAASPRAASRPEPDALPCGLRAALVAGALPRACWRVCS